MTTQDKIEHFLANVEQGAAKALPPATMTPQQFVTDCRMVLALSEDVAAVAQNKPADLLRALMVAASLGLSPHPAKKHFHIVPFKGKLETIVGYRGLIHAAKESPQVRDVDAVLVYRATLQQLRAEGKRIVDPETGIPNVVDEDAALLPDDQAKDEHIVGALAVAYIRDDLPISRFLAKHEIEKRRRFADSKSEKGSKAWRESYAAMARKSAIIALLNSGRVPLSERVLTLTAAERDYDEPEEPIQAEFEAVQPLPSPKQMEPSPTDQLFPRRGAAPVIDEDHIPM